MQHNYHLHPTALYFNKIRINDDWEKIYTKYKYCITVEIHS